MNELLNTMLSAAKAEVSHRRFHENRVISDGNKFRCELGFLEVNFRDGKVDVWTQYDCNSIPAANYTMPNAYGCGCRNWRRRTALPTHSKATRSPGL